MKTLLRIAGFLAVGAVGFVVDWLVLQLGLHAGLGPAVARAISIVVAMQVTFVGNGRFVFSGFEAGRLLRQWLGYMLACSLGNSINYLVFLGLIASRLPALSTHAVAFLVAAVIGSVANYLGIGRLAFGKAATPPA